MRLGATTARSPVLIPDPDDHCSKASAGIQPIDPWDGHGEPEPAKPNHFTEELPVAFERQIDHFVIASERDLEPRQVQKRSLRLHQAKEKRRKEQNLQLFPFCTI
jgi:hypothetical protein